MSISKGKQRAVTVSWLDSPTFLGNITVNDSVMCVCVRGSEGGEVGMSACVPGWSCSTFLLIGLVLIHTDTLVLYPNHSARSLSLSHSHSLTHSLAPLHTWTNSVVPSCLLCMSNYRGNIRPGSGLHAVHVLPGVGARLARAFLSVYLCSKVYGAVMVTPPSRLFYTLIT